MTTIRSTKDNARDPLETLRALDARLLLAMQHADLLLLDAIGHDVAQRWRDDMAETEQAPR